MLGPPPITTEFDWYPDSGASHHITPDLASLHTAEDYKGTNKVLVGNGKGLSIAHVGTSSVPYSPNSFLSLKNVLHVPEITKPLLSVHRLCNDNDCSIEFFPNHCLMKDCQTKEVILRRTCDLGLYKLHSAPLSTSSPIIASLSTLYTWHQRLGHPNFAVVHRLLHQFQLPCKNKDSLLNNYHACYLGKMHRSSLSLTNHRSSQPLELIHSDV